MAWKTSGAIWLALAPGRAKDGAVVGLPQHRSNVEFDKVSFALQCHHSKPILYGSGRIATLQNQRCRRPAAPLQ